MPDQRTIEGMIDDSEARDLVAGLATGIPAILGGNLVALYLTGSLTYGDFDAGSSDIDYLAIMEREITPVERSALARLHDDLGSRFPAWRERMEGSFVTRDMLGHVLPPPMSRPYVNQGAFWDPNPPYGNEWLINLYAIQESGIALFGPEPHDLLPPVRIEDVREASRRDLFEERLPELDDPGFLPDSHHEAYVTLTLCRILHRQFDDG
ncbi:MAG TPA: hypothetical protein VD767_01980, partial [Thermomicrobiales bacterium]|nr:hypothetical protein [Thermomicrobiales bacterium]